MTKEQRGQAERSEAAEKPGLSGGLARGVALKWSALLESLRLAAPRSALRMPRGIAAWAETELSGEMHRGWRGASSALDESNAALVARIRAETEALNRNNVTRTAAYLDVYRAYPELHWALLAHLVSRNGGWNMTDLQGAWLPRLLTQRDRSILFGMLESSNALIFRDAYPQLSLYRESRRTGRSRFGLLPAFGVSAFMQPFWERFWIERDPVPLTVALIVNEQQVIQRRVIQDAAYKDTVLGSAAFKSMTPLQLQQVVFPLGGVLPRRGGGPAAVLAGRVLEAFASVDERIAFGKSLYAMLFAYPKVLGGALAFAERVAHTGSRADYWPDRFAADGACGRSDSGQGDGAEGAAVGSGGEARGGAAASGGMAHGAADGTYAEARRAAPGSDGTVPGGSDGVARHAAPGGAGLWYSPRLAAAWPDRPLGPVDEGDWLGDLSVLRHFRTLRPPRVFVMTHEHEFGQRKLEAASLALDRLAPRHSPGRA